MLVFEDVNIVIHAALRLAKHVEMSELNVFDCINTNVSGVDNVVKAPLKITLNICIYKQ